MRIRMDIQAGRRVLPSLAEWLVQENVRFYATLPPGTSLGPRALGVQADGDPWHWHDARLLPLEARTSMFAWAAARAAELRVSGWRAIAPQDAAWARAQRLRPSSIPAEVVLRQAPGYDRESGELYWWVAIRYRLGGMTFMEGTTAASVTLRGPVYLHIVFGENKSVRLLNWLAEWNAEILRRKPSLPGLYASGVRYERETEETWSDYINLLLQKWEDCDALAAARAGELKARGWRALAPGDDGYAEAKRRRSRIEARVFMRTRLAPGKPGLYHCLVRYRLPGGEWMFDDPSARLGMLDRRMNAQEVQERLHIQKHGKPRPARSSAARTRTTKRK